MTPSNIHISVISPVYRAAECLEELYRRLVSELEGITADFEIILVEDCGGDHSWQIIQRLATLDERVRGIQFSRNYGQHYAITAGLDHARGDYVIVMDCDLQDRPEDIHRLYKEAQRGYDIVLARRTQRHEPFLKRLSGSLFYLIFNYLTDVKFDKAVGGFCILSKKVVDAISAYRESSRFLMAFVNSVGFPTSFIETQQAERYQGKSSYSLRRLLSHAFNTSLGFSAKPLRIAINIGAVMACVSFISAILVYGLATFGTLEVSGWASLMISLWFLSGLILAQIGIVGIYLGLVFHQTKNRPLYIVRRDTDSDKNQLGEDEREIESVIP
ncbi:MAG: glycosyltransferase family 2 protein [Planctomycetota bacterium]|jgi:dolichol-phosphate mannosyltransferase|nr:glycosyltransferase family 2 protein [Planctomycetota bacterium]